jgi:purine-binding chemotaxis protein CheW
VSRSLTTRSRRGDPRGALRAIEGREEFLSFGLGGECYAVPVRRVKEILKAPPVTEVPRGPDDLVGIVAIRGAVLPVRDLRRRLALAARPATRRSRILVVDHEGEPLGLLVDDVREVVRLLPGEIEATPSVVPGLEADAITGVARPEGEMIILLGLDGVLRDEGEG